MRTRPARVRAAARAASDLLRDRLRSATDWASSAVVVMSDRGDVLVVTDLPPSAAEALLALGRRKMAGLS
jgi:hypothetical protein